MVSVPFVSIGLPVFNGDAYVSQMLDSILSQTFADFEVIISDNASTDSSRSICEQYVQRDPRVRLYSNDRNHGASWNYKRVFEMARGKYFRWAAADDVFGAESLEACVDVLEKHPDAALCYPATTLIDAAGQVIRPHHENLDLRMESPAERFIACLKQLGMGNVIYGLMRSEMVRRTRLIGNFPGADLIFIPELAIYGKFIEIDRPLFFRRMHEGSSSSLKTVEEIQEFFDPATKGRAFARYMVHCNEHLRSVLRSPLKICDKARLLLFLCRGVVSSRDVFLGELFPLLRKKSCDKPRV